MALNYTFKKGTAAAVSLNSFPKDSTASHNFRVHVDKSEGIIGKPDLKNVVAFDWKYLHGTTPDLRNRRYKEKEITVSCWIKADSKQQMIERYDAFLSYFRHDDLIMMKVTWATDNDNGGARPNPHVSKGLFAMVYLKKVNVKRQNWRFGRNYIRFDLVFGDPYPMKRILKYTGTAGDGVDYDIVSETEIDIFTEGGLSYYDILSGSGHIAASLGEYILVCGDVVHSTDSNGGDNIVVPTTPNEDSVTTIYTEI